MTDGARTRDIQNHNLELYQLSYGHQRKPPDADNGTSRRVVIVTVWAVIVNTGVLLSRPKLNSQRGCGPTEKCFVLGQMMAYRAVEVSERSRRASSAASAHFPVNQVRYNSSHITPTTTVELASSLQNLLNSR